MSCNLLQILIISPEPWNAHFVSKHHYAISLAKMEIKVYYLDPPDDSVGAIQINKTNHDNLYNIIAPKVASGLRFYPRFLRKWIEARWLKKLEKQIGCSFDVIWLFENSRFYNMEFASKRLKIYHQVDLNQNFHIKEAASSADICFCTTDFIKKELVQFNDKVYKIHHGTAINAIKKELPNHKIKCFSRLNSNVSLIGNLNIPFLNITIIQELVKQYPEVMFHFVGDYSEKSKLFENCKEFTNIVWWGRVESNFIPEVLLKSDVLLLIYKASNEFERMQLASPHKVMEYLASGKTIVATYTAEYKNKPGLLEMANGDDEFINTFDKVINNLQIYNSEEKQKMRKSFAMDNTYEKQLSRILVYLKNHQLIDTE